MKRILIMLGVVLIFMSGCGTAASQRESIYTENEPVNEQERNDISPVTESSHTTEKDNSETVDDQLSSNNPKKDKTTSSKADSNSSIADTDRNSSISVSKEQSKVSSPLEESDVSHESDFQESVDSYQSKVSENTPNDNTDYIVKGNVIYGTDDYCTIFYEENVPVDGTTQLDAKLESALNSYSDMMYAVKIQVFDPEKEEKKNSFLSGYSKDGYTYTEVTERINSIFMTINSSKDYDYDSLTSELEQLDIIKRDMEYEADQYCLEAEGNRLVACGINVQEITKNKGYENYIVAIVSEQDITTMPFDSRISYKIGLSPFSYKRDYYDEG